MIESLNNTSIILFIVILYLFLVLFSLILISSYIREYSNKLLNKFSELIRINSRLETTLNFIEKEIFGGIRTIVSKFTGLLFSLSQYFNKFDTILDVNVFNNISEPANFSALTLRKLYEGNTQSWLLYSVLIIVAFYFILTIF